MKRKCTHAHCQGIQAPTETPSSVTLSKLSTKSDKFMPGVSVISSTFSHIIITFPAHILFSKLIMETQELPFVRALTVRRFSCPNASRLKSVGKSSEMTGLAYGCPTPTRASTIPPPFVKT